MLTVADTGEGMSPQTRAQIFEPFFTTKREGKGTGLGLATVYGIVRQSGGWIDVASEVGEGTTFSLYFPATERARRGRSTPPRRCRRASPRVAARVLVVEDQPEVRELAVRGASPRRLRGRRSHRWRRGAARFVDRAASLSLLLTDVVMPGMNGRELAERLRAANPRLLVVYMSGYTQEILDHAGARRAGRGVRRQALHAGGTGAPGRSAAARSPGTAGRSAAVARRDGALTAAPHLRDDAEMSAPDALSRGRDAFTRDAWADAWRELAAADAEAPLAGEDLDRLATAAFLIGEDDASAEVRARAHASFVERGDPVAAVRSAYWLFFALIDRPAHRAQAQAWLARARRLLDECGADCVEAGFLLCAHGFLRATSGDAEAGLAAFEAATAIGARFADPTLLALARHGTARCFIRGNRTAEGFVLLDEVMLAIAGGEVVPMIRGTVYCSVISACHDAFDLRRAQEWTTALSGWCAAHPDMVPFRAQCLVRRAELLQWQGDWPEATAEARRAAEWSGRTDVSHHIAAACYQEGELHRLRGEFAAADACYRRATVAGQKPFPGAALLRLAEGDLDAAEAVVRCMLIEDPRSADAGAVPRRLRRGAARPGRPRRRPRLRRRAVAARRRDRRDRAPRERVARRRLGGARRRRRRHRAAPAARCPHLLAGAGGALPGRRRPHDAGARLSPAGRRGRRATRVRRRPGNIRAARTTSHRRPHCHR